MMGRFCSDRLLDESRLIWEEKLQSRTQTDGRISALQQDEKKQNKKRLFVLQKAGEKKNLLVRECYVKTAVNDSKNTHQGSKNVVVVLSHHTHGQGLRGGTQRHHRYSIWTLWVNNIYCNISQCFCLIPTTHISFTCTVNI